MAKHRVKGSGESEGVAKNNSKQITERIMSFVEVHRHEGKWALLRRDEICDGEWYELIFLSWKDHRGDLLMREWREPKFVVYGNNPVEIG